MKMMKHVRYSSHLFAVSGCSLVVWAMEPFLKKPSSSAWQDEQVVSSGQLMNLMSDHEWSVCSAVYWMGLLGYIWMLNPRSVAIPTKEHSVFGWWPLWQEVGLSERPRCATKQTVKHIKHLVLTWTSWRSWTRHWVVWPSSVPVSPDQVVPLVRSPAFTDRTTDRNHRFLPVPVPHWFDRWRVETKENGRPDKALCVANVGAGVMRPDCPGLLLVFPRFSFSSLS